MKIQKNLQWIEPFLDQVSDLVPLHKVKAIKGYRIPKNKQELILAQCKYEKRRYTITLLTHEQVFVILPNGDRRFKKYNHLYLAEFLENLAHELSHLKYWIHDGNHFSLQGKILQRFSKVLHTLDIDETYGRIP